MRLFIGGLSQQLTHSTQCPSPLKSFLLVKLDKDLLGVTGFKNPSFRVLQCGHI